MSSFPFRARRGRISWPRCVRVHAGFAITQRGRKGTTSPEVRVAGVPATTDAGSEQRGYALDAKDELQNRLKSLRYDFERDPEAFCRWVLGLRDEASLLRDKLEASENIMSALLECGSLDLECIYDMQKNHPGTIDRALELKEELASINFGNFVMGVKDEAINEVEGEIDREDAESFRDMIIDDNYVAWGGVASYGSYEGEDREENQMRQELFANFVNGSLGKEEFLEEYRDASSGREGPRLRPSNPESGS